MSAVGFLAIADLLPYTVMNHPRPSSSSWCTDVWNLKQLAPACYASMFFTHLLQSPQDAPLQVLIFRTFLLIVIFGQLIILVVTCYV